MDLQAHLRATVEDPDHIESVPLTIFREGWIELVSQLVASDGRDERKRVTSRSRRRAKSPVRDMAASQISAMGRALADSLGIEYWSQELLDTEFPVEHNGEVAKLRDFDREMADKRLMMLRSNAAGIMEDIALIEDGIRLMSQTGARTIGEAVHASSR